jgi:GT2 family glycosyltransferase
MAHKRSQPPLVAPPGPVRDDRDVPSFSVVIAAYQAEATVAAAVTSALNQTRPPLEVIVCDDGSTDGTEQALTPFGNRIVLLRQENGGEASAKNAGVRASSGEYVAILDADDLFLPRRLEALAAAAATRPDLDILTTDAHLELAGRRVKQCYEGGMRFVIDDQRRGILESNFIFGQVAVRRERLAAVGGFDESIRWTTDWDCWIRMILSGSSAGLVDEPLAVYRITTGSLSAQRSRLFAGRVQTIEKALKRDDLRPAERDTACRAMTVNQRLLTLSTARDALTEGSPGVRRLWLKIAVGRGFRPKTRAKALGLLLAPSVGRKYLFRQERETTAGIALPPLEPPPPTV